MLSEAEIVSKHVQSLGEAKEHCAQLARCQDPMIIMPKGWRYGKLRSALRELEGSCRQMAHYRADARWLKLGIVYARMQRAVQSCFVNHEWAAFAKMAALFENGLFQMDSLKNRKTGRTGMILPSEGTDWLILPDHVIPQPRMVPVGHA